ncbi:linear amide C-N hydrolase [Polynucleobacter sp. CS-Odin-A6]|uniref:linear amide C-N hydrolase n=1 Tax=Polynucleobacter sp. CS-Odin-A6 TaxID=2689106 RepID=UPI001C0B9231|nr:linear amide C-N hydrolase [Polynucleobacter sp. CS-Odin-A6]MBU3622009.1 linear amide C-N hydrolase [Polynucleobacter sp. CS-Odin-A6]
MKIKFISFVSVVLASIMVFTPVISHACSSFVLRSQDGNYVYGRTIEFGVALPTKLALYPRNHQYKGAGPDGVIGSGLNWTGKNAVVGIQAMGMEIIADGLNEKGLTGGMLYLPVSSLYQSPTGADAKNSIASYQVLNWVLSNFDNVADVKAGLQKIFVNNSNLAQWKGVVKMHYTFHDKTGKSIVVEYVDAKLNIYDNPIGALTNEPPFNWQLMNIENYLNLSPIEVGSKKIAGATFAPRSAGSGLHGLPGDFMSQSRLLRAVQFSQGADKYAADMPKVDLAWHLANLFDLPPGSVIGGDKPNAKGKYDWDYSQVTIVSDSKNLAYYTRPFRGKDINQFNLKDHDLNGKEVKQWEIGATTTYKAVK